MAQQLGDSRQLHSRVNPHTTGQMRVNTQMGISPVLGGVVIRFPLRYTGCITKARGSEQSPQGVRAS